MKFLFDLFPIALFFTVFKWGKVYTDAAHTLATQSLSWLVSGGIVTETQAPILLATAVAILATIGQITYLLARRKKVSGMLWVSFAVIAIFGGATIYFHNEEFIKWKPTVLYWLFSLTLLISQLGFKRNLIRTIMEEQLTLPDPIWQGVGLSWAVFFAVMGALNHYVASNFSEAAWVNFKLFGSTGLMLAFVVVQSIMLSKHMKDTP